MSLAKSISTSELEETNQILESLESWAMANGFNI